MKIDIGNTYMKIHIETYIHKYICEYIGNIYRKYMKGKYI